MKWFEKLDNVVKELNLTHIDWIKIDVDGAENLVVDGMKNTLSISHNILIESRHYNVNHICDLLKDKFMITINDHISYLGKGSTCYILAKRITNWWIKGNLIYVSLYTILNF